MKYIAAYFLLSGLIYFLTLLLVMDEEDAENYGVISWLTASILFGWFLLPVGIVLASMEKVWRKCKG